MFKLLILLSYSIFVWNCNGFTIKKVNHHEASQKNYLFELSIIHLNDFHARFVQTNPASNTCHEGEEATCLGGLARVMTITKQILSEKSDAIFLNAGDNYQGTLWYNVHKWRAMLRFMNKLPHDAMTLGNHEFDDGIDGLTPFLRNFNAPVVVCNIDDSEEPLIQGLYKKSITIKRRDHVIGVIGVIAKDTSVTSKGTGKLKFSDEVESVNAEVEKLKARGIKIIIVLSHSGIETDKRIAANCPGVDVIVGGHSHTLLYTGEAPSGKASDKYPVLVKQEETNRTVLVVQAASYTKYLGNLSVWFDAEGEIADWQGNPIFLGHSIQQDAEILRELEPWAKAINAFSDNVIGETTAFLNGNCYEGECNLGNLITDAMVHAYRKITDNSTHASIGCINSGGVRSSIPQGDITYGDVMTVLPFEGTYDAFELKGEHLLKTLEYAVINSGNDQSIGMERLLHWSGIRVVYNLTNPAWSRVIEVLVRCQTCEEASYEELREDEWYSIVTDSFLLNVGEAPFMRKYHRNRQIGPKDIDVVIDYIKEISPIDYGVDRRIQLVN